MGAGYYQGQQPKPGIYAQQPMYPNQDLMMAAARGGMMYEDDYYDDEIDEEEYQHALMMQQQQRGNLEDPQMLRIQQLQKQGYEIMEEEMSEDYNPNDEEIEQYAKFLGMDVNEDKDLFYIAKEGLKAPLPNPWKPCRSPGGSIYYYNFDTEQMQKEHPCDDYYMNYYEQERKNLVKKKEEQIIKKKQKETKKSKKSSNSMNNSSIHGQSVSAVNQNNSLQMAMMMNMSGIDSSAVINERVQLELEKIMDEGEEQKIQHERKRREELKKLETENQESKKKIEKEAKEHVDEIKRKNKSISSQDLTQQRKTDMQIEKDKRIRELREQERQRQGKQEKQMQTKVDKRRDENKREEEQRHKLESENIRQSYAQKLDLERDRIRDENNRLLEESGDIDFQVRLFKADLLEGQIQSQKFELEEEFRKKLKEYKEDLKKRLEKEKERIQGEFDSRLDREKEKEQRKLKLERSKVEDKIEELKKANILKMKEEKKTIEKKANEKIRERKMEAEDEIESAKTELKLQIHRQYEAKEQKIGKDLDQLALQRKEAIERHERDKKDWYEEERERVSIEHEEQMKKERIQFQESLNEKSENYQTIIKNIEDLKSKVKEAKGKEQDLEKEVKKKASEISDLELEKRGKERELKNADSFAAERDYKLEAQLKRDLQEKQEELLRLKQMIRDRKDQKLSVDFKVDGAYEDSDIAKLTHDLDEVKKMVLELRNQKPSQTQQNQRISFGVKERKKPMLMDYSLAEIEAYIEVHLPKVKHKREKYEEDRLLLRQLLANIERNRMRMRKEISALSSHSRKIVMQSVKEKIDEQAMMLEEEERLMKEKCDYYRRKEEKLRAIQQKVAIITGRDKFEDEPEDTERRDNLLLDIQVDYDKYLKLYQKEEALNKRGRSQLRNQSLVQFQEKWADYLIEEADEDLRPIIGLDPNRQLFKPSSLYHQYHHSDALYKSNIAMHHVYEHEATRVRENKDQIKRFLNDQQRWIANFRDELSAVPASRGIHHIGSNETLFQLKQNLSSAFY